MWVYRYELQWTAFGWQWVLTRRFEPVAVVHNPVGYIATPGGAIQTRPSRF